MKPKFDLDNAVTNFAIQLLRKQAIEAYDTAQDVEKAVIPIYALLKSKSHQRPKTKSEQIGSGVLLKLKDQFFILSSTHVFEAFEGMVLQTGFGKRTLVERLEGERYSTGKIDNPYGNYLDASVFHIQSQISDDLKNIAIGIDDLELYDPDENTKPMYLTTGFRVKLSNTSGDEIKTRREAFTTIEMDEETYIKLGINKEAQIVTAHEDDILVGKHWQKSPRIRGFSGGGLIVIKGSNLHDPRSLSQTKKQKLRGIIIEQHREKDKNPGFVLSTKVNVHLGLIAQFLPEVLKGYFDLN